MKKTIFIILQFCLFCSVLIKAQTWTSYTTTNSGLPNPLVLGTVVDNSGNKWVATDGGLSKFNGTTWTTYNTTNSGIPSNLIRGIAIDNAGVKWIGTAGGGFAKFDGTTWTTLLPPSFGPDPLALAVAIDQSENKWFGTNNGLLKFDGTTWTTYSTSNSGLPDYTVNCITVDDAGNKWIGTQGGLAKFDGTTWTTYKTSNSSIPSNKVRAIAIDNQGNKWIGTQGGGLAKFNGTTWTVYNSSNSGIALNFVSSIAIDNSTGTKWIGLQDVASGVGGGVAKFDGTTWTTYKTSNSGLLDDFVFGITLDNAGNKWIGTNGSGLSKLSGAALPSINVNPSLLAFGNQNVGSSSPSKTFTITNFGTAALTVSNISYPTGFSGDWSGGTIAAGGTKVINIVFTPTQAIAYNGYITISSNAAFGSNSIQCSGTGNASPPVADFTWTANLLAITFSNVSTNGTTYLWDFGDGQTSTQTSPSHTYATPGSYNICLTASTAGGNNTTCHSITVFATPTNMQTSCWSIAKTQGCSEFVFDIKFPDSLHGWVVGNNGYILHTSDGGATWNQQTANITSAIARSFFFNSTVGFTSGANYICKTTNGGQTWTSTSLGNVWLLDIFFINTTTGWAAGRTYGGNGIVLKTIDGGATWQNISFPSAMPALGGVFFINSNTGWIVGASGKIFKTTDGGNNWSPQTSPTTNQLNNVFFLNQQLGWISAGSMVLKTLNGGITWDSISPILNVQYFQTLANQPIRFFDANNGFCMDHITNDGGHTWHRPCGDFSYGTINTWTPACFTNMNNAWVLSDQTSNGGTISNIKNTPKPPPSPDAYFPKQNAYDIQSDTRFAWEADIHCSVDGFYVSVGTTLGGQDVMSKFSVPVGHESKRFIGQNGWVAPCSQNYNYHIPIRNLPKGTKLYASVTSYNSFGESVPTIIPFTTIDYQEDCFLQGDIRWDTIVTGSDTLLRITTPKLPVSNEGIIYNQSFESGFQFDTLHYVKVEDRHGRKERALRMSVGGWEYLPYQHNPVDFAVSLWMKDAYDINSGNAAIKLFCNNKFTISKPVFSPNNFALKTWYISNFCINYANDSQSPPIEVGYGVYDPSKWNHFVLTFKDSVATAYVNGIISDQKILQDKTKGLLLGVHYLFDNWLWSGGSSNNIIYDDFLLFYRALDSNEVKQLYTYKPPMSTIDTAICAGQSLEFMGNQYDSAGCYQVVLPYEHAKGCDSTIIVNLTVLSKLLAEAGNDLTPCPGDLIQLQATGGVSYQWSNGIQQKVDFVANSSQTYFVTITDQSGCTATDSLRVEVISIPPTTAPLQTVCFEEAPGFSLPDGSTINPSPGTTIYPVIYTTVAGCDSMVNYPIVVKPALITNLPSKVICSGECVTVGGEDFCDSGNHSVTVTTYQGCDSTINFTLTVLEPIAEIIGSGTISCSNPSVQLSSQSVPGVKTWKNGSGQQIGTGPNLTVTQTGIYILTNTLTQGGTSCSAMDTIEILADPNSLPSPMVQKSGDLNCAIGSVTLSATNPVPSSTGQWWGPDGALPTGSVVSVTQSGAYTFIVTATGGCTSSASVTVLKDATNGSTATINAGQTVLTCGQPLLTLNGFPFLGPAGLYSWSVANGGHIVSLSGADASIDAAGDYFLIVTDPNCSDTAFIKITADKTQPDAVAVGGTIFCNVNQIALQGSSTTPGAIFSWSGPNGFVSQSQNPTVTQTGIYTLTVTGPNGCTKTATASVVADAAAPNATVTASDTTVCLGQSVQLSVPVGAASYNWNVAGLNGSSPTVTPNILGNISYVVTVTGNNGCKATGNIQLTVVSAITAAINGPAKSCEDAFLTLSTAVVGAVASYSWFPTGQTGQQLTVKPDNPTTLVFTVTVTSAEGCTVTATKSVQIIDQPDVAISPSNLVVCQDSIVSLNAQGALAYQWIGLAQTTPTIKVQPSTTTEYKVIGTSDPLCPDTAAVTVTVRQPPFSNAGIDATVCVPDAALHATMPAGADGQWLELDQGQTVTPSGPNSLVNNLGKGQNRFVWYVENKPCEGFAADTVSVFYENTIPQLGNDGALVLPDGDIEIELLKNDTLSGLPNYTIKLKNQDMKGDWLLKPGGVLFFEPNLDSTGTATALYKLCNLVCPDLCDSASVRILISGPIRNNGTGEIAITPGLDGMNDVLVFPWLDQYPNNEIQIFNRWGSLVHQAKPYKNDWGGTYKGNELPEGTYFYYLYLNSGNTYDAQKGSILLIRTR